MYPIWKCDAPKGLMQYTGVSCKSSEIDCSLVSPRSADYEGLNWPEINKQLQWDSSSYGSGFYIFNKFFAPATTGKCVLDGDIFLK